MLNHLSKAGLDSRLERFRRAQTFALEQLVTIHTVSSDLRWALIELALRSIAALLTAGGRHLVFRSRRLVKRVRLATHFTPADTMVAAGGR
ncbi:hypothetical protein [Bradyrhizobium sp. Leo170]|uniref:hypothetical protein n=1 Tax=Bradyrhizobium sp. Leo170 TaxID=1571199 RepID=UPI00102E2D64|nr:hypothetical protein [Bradyrhizobium sp. Leo170]TAI60953.1 hypothetical protein CWO89_37845 [Bradyrhizobium sp. Leo170]